MQQAEALLGHAAVLAEAFAVPTVLVHVLEQAEGSVPDLLAWHLREEAEAALNQAAERLRSRDLPAASIEPNPSARLLAEDNTVVRRPAPRRQVTS